MGDSVLALTKQQFSYSIKSATPITIGENSNSFIILCDNGKQYFVKGVVSAPARSIRRLQREARVLSSLSTSSTFCVPSVIDFWTDENSAVLVCSIVPGDVWGENVLANWRTLSQDLGAVLHDIHSFVTTDISSNSEYGKDGIGLVFETKDALLETQFEKYQNQVDVYAEILRNTAPEYGLIHGDFHPPNLLFDSQSGSVVSIIDWEYSGVSDITIDIAKAEFRFFELYHSTYNQIEVSYADCIELFRDSYGGYEDINLTRLSAIKNLYLLRECGLVATYGELDLWNQTSKQDALSACHSCLNGLEQNTF